MSKDFDTTLCDAIDLAAAAAHTAGASAARLRGRKRTMRKRIAVSTLSFVLVATGTAVAFKYAGSGNGGRPQVTTTGPLVTPSPSLSQSPSQSASPTVSPTTPATGLQSPVTTSPPATGTSSPAATVADPHQLVDAAWLSPSQMPFASTFRWTAIPSSGSGQSLLGQPLSPTVAYVAKDTVFQALNVCGDPAQLLARTIGAQQAGDDAATIKRSGASQFIFFFADAASAQQTFAWLQSQYGPSCMPGFGGMSFTKTAGDAVTSAAWLTVEHPSAGSVPVDLQPYNREYFVLRGSTIASVGISSATSSVGSPHDDAAELSAIAKHLCVYGGPCH